MRFAVVLAMLGCTAGACAEGVSGRVFDETGAVVTGARVVLLQDFNKLTETKSDQQGSFAFRELHPGTYQVQVKQPWFQIFQQLVTLEPQGNARVYAVLGVARAETGIGVARARVPDAQPDLGVDKPFRLGGRVEGLKRTGGRMPAWPEAAARRGASGVVALHATVKADGTVANVLVLEAPDPDLEREALEAFQTWKFQPMKLDGQAVECRQVFVCQFRYE